MYASQRDNYAYIMGIYKSMTENTWTRLVDKIASNILEVTTTGAVATVPTAMGSMPGNTENPTNVNALGQNKEAVMAAKEPPVPISATPAQVFSDIKAPTTKIKTKKYVGEAAEDLPDLLDLLFRTSEDDINNPLKKPEPTLIGKELNK